MKDLDFFPAVNLIVSNACRMQCDFCCAETSKYKSTTIEKDSLFKMIDILYSNGTQRICFSGGEPLLNPYIAELLKYSYNYNLTNTIMSSDGKAISKINFDPKFIDTFWISVHGINEYHDNITNVVNSFSDIQNAIESKKNYPFGIWSVVTPQNKETVDKLIEWCIGENIKKIYLSNLNLTGKGAEFVSDNGRISDKEFEKLVNYYHNKYIEYITVSGQKFNKNAQCTLVYPDGNVYITPYDNEEYQLLVGNILNEDPKGVFSRIKGDINLWADYTYRYNNLTLTRK